MALCVARLRGFFLPYLDDNALKNESSLLVLKNEFLAKKTPYNVILIFNWFFLIILD